MGKYLKFSDKQKRLIVNLYSIENMSIPNIMKECDFEISKSTIYNILRENNVNFLRKRGFKHDIIGKTFGFLIVRKMAQTEKSTKAQSWRAICDCKCGNKNIDVHPQALIRNQTTSCGCRRDQYNKTRGKNSSLYKGYEDISGKYWGIIKDRAIRRGYNIEIDIKFVWELYLKQGKKCKLSGLPIYFANANRKVSETTASLDRIDSTKGYIKDNVQWVHKKVNIMKNKMPEDEFIRICKLIANLN